MKTRRGRYQLISPPTTDNWSQYVGKHIPIRDTMSGKIYYGRLQIMHHPPRGKHTFGQSHKIYALAQFKVNGKTKQIYLGVARSSAQAYHTKPYLPVPGSKATGKRKGVKH